MPRKMSEEQRALRLAASQARVAELGVIAAAGKLRVRLDSLDREARSRVVPVLASTLGGDLVDQVAAYVAGDEPPQAGASRVTRVGTHTRGEGAPS